MQLNFEVNWKWDFKEYNFLPENAKHTDQLLARYFIKDGVFLLWNDT